MSQRKYSLKAEVLKKQMNIFLEKLIFIMFN